MKPVLKRVLLRVLKITGIGAAIILSLLFILPYLFPATIEKKIKQWANDAIVSDLNFSKARLSFFNHFPSLTLTLYDFSLTGSAPFRKDTLINAGEISFGVNLFTIFSEKIKVNQVFLSDAVIDCRINASGQANYNVYKSDTTAVTDTAASNVGLQLESIVIENSRLRYDDNSVPLVITAQNFNYTGKGDFSKSIFDLNTRLTTDSFSFIYNGAAYVNRKQIRARLTTRINTHSLSLVFEKNRLRINQLPVQFSGKFDFLKNGYDMDFRLSSRKSTLDQILSAIPPDLAAWLDDTKVKGTAEFDMKLKGVYSKESNAMPDFSCSVKLREGYISHTLAPSPIRDLFLNMDVSLSDLNTDSMHVVIDSVFFRLDKGYVSAVSNTIGLAQPYIKARMNADVDLALLNKAIGLKEIEMKGNCAIGLTADGSYTTGQNPAKWRKEIIITSIPRFNVHADLRNGYFKYASLPQAIHDISFNLTTSCADSNYHNIQFAAENIHATALKNNIDGYVKYNTVRNTYLDAKLTSIINLASLKDFLPLDSLVVQGDMAVAVKSQGVYDPGQKKFPVTQSNIELKNGSIQTPYYPHPVSKINIITEAVNTSGTLADTRFSVKPVTFEFEGQPFTIKAEIQNPDDIQYDIVSDGVIDIGKIYKVFSKKGYDVTGFLQADLKLRGKQSDAAAKRYNRLFNEGKLIMKDIAVTTEFYPMPFFIHSGTFTFNQDKMWFNRFDADYGKSHFLLNGFLSNTLNYISGNKDVLSGEFNIHTDRLFADEFMAFAGNTDSTQHGQDSTTATGVFVVPRNLSVQINMDAGTINYNKLDIKNFKGKLSLDSGKLKLKETSFRLIDAGINMSAAYENTSPLKALFSFQLKADSFSIAKAYNEIPLFRAMASSASGVQGIVGLDYSLNGRLDEHMSPVYPSLKGGGVLSVKKVSLKGFKLLNAVGSSTNHEEIKNADVSSINIKSAIANNIINIERVKLRIAGLRPRFEGQVSLDGKLNLKGRLGLPPLGIIGIPFMVSGTSDNPSIKLKKDKQGKLLQETEDKEADTEPETLQN